MAQFGLLMFTVKINLIFQETAHVTHQNKAMCSIFTYKNKCKAHTVHSFFPSLSTFSSTTVCFQPWARRRDLSLPNSWLYFCFDVRRPSPNHSLRVWTSHNTTKTTPTALEVTRLHCALHCIFQCGNLKSACRSLKSSTVSSLQGTFTFYLDRTFSCRNIENSHSHSEVQPSSGNLKGIPAGAEKWSLNVRVTVPGFDRI